MKLEEIGFYTLCDARAKNVSLETPMWRTEIILSDKCNFKCPYCRGLKEKGDLPIKKVKEIINIWAEKGLKNIRFSGGEPTMYPYLFDAVRRAQENIVERVAVSTNGSADFDTYFKLFLYGVNDFSISMDACCSTFGEKMCGVKGAWEKVVENIRRLSELTYVTVGVVFTKETAGEIKNVVEFADGLGVADIRIISAAQFNEVANEIKTIPEKILQNHPILKYRVNNFRNGRNVRGITKSDWNRCGLVVDDSAVLGNYHYPCIIYLREGGQPIGKINKNMRAERFKWFKKHDTHADEICRKNCLDVCIDYNNKVRDNGRI